MEEFTGYSSAKKSLTGFVCAIGNFDGIHLGHQALIKETMKMAEECRCQSAVFTFEPHPKIFFNGEGSVSLIYNKEKKHALLSSFGLSALIAESFDKKLASLDAEPFIKEIFVKTLKVRGIVVGANFRFGRDATGDTALLRNILEKENIKLKVIEDVLVDDSVCSSSVIRDFLRKGLVERANRFLGRNFSIKGFVVRGEGRGHKIGVPTVNILPESDLICLKTGVYMTKVLLQNKESYFAATNVGHRPTFGKNGRLIIESHLLSFTKDLYGQEIEINFLEKIREETSFPSKEALVKQIKQDLSSITDKINAQD